jgi:dihydroorotase
MNKYLIINSIIVNEGKIAKGTVDVLGEFINDIIYEDVDISTYYNNGYEIIDAEGKYLIPGVIDDQVHFREPGLTHKGDISSESRAAIAGGVTSFMDMPNNNPPATTQELLENKYKTAAERSFANYSFFFGATNDNYQELIKTDRKNVCGVKVFMGSSTGNMLVDNPEMLEQIFQTDHLIAIHSENEDIIKKNIQIFKERYGNDISFDYHPEIRSEEACYTTTQLAIKLAKKNNTRLHILHLSTAKEIELLESGPVENKRITAEVCVHHLLFDKSDYAEFKGKIKCNPAIKNETDKKALLTGVLSDKIDIIATDHAPHTETEKQSKYFSCPSGIPLVQHSLVAMLELYHNKEISLEMIIEKICHAPAKCYRIEKRGFIRKGYFADLVIVDTDSPWKVEKENILYKCGWSPFEGKVFKSQVCNTFVNGSHVYNNGVLREEIKGRRLSFNL